MLLYLLKFHGGNNIESIIIVKIADNDTLRIRLVAHWIHCWCSERSITISYIYIYIYMYIYHNIVITAISDNHKIQFILFTYIFYSTWTQKEIDTGHVILTTRIYIYNCRGFDKILSVKQKIPSTSYLHCSSPFNRNLGHFNIKKKFWKKISFLLKKLQCKRRYYWIIIINSNRKYQQSIHI